MGGGLTHEQCRDESDRQGLKFSQQVGFPGLDFHLGVIDSCDELYIGLGVATAGPQVDDIVDFKYRMVVEPRVWTGRENMRVGWSRVFST